jgi:NAD-dependent SIR2 family protein deacetylase
MRNQLLRNYSQNIDTLETISGIDKVTMCHGSFATATCIICKYKVKADDIKEKVLSGEIPFCPNCSTLDEQEALKYAWSTSFPEPGLDDNRDHSRRLSAEEDDDDYFPSEDPFPLPPVIKPDIVFFGEDLPDEFHNSLNADKPICDLLLVIGSSLRVRPVSLIPSMLPPEVPQILINRESLPHCTFDIELLGNCDAIISYLCRHLGPDFSDLASTKELKQVDKLPRDNYQNEILEPKDPQSENDIQALKACWEPKVNENISSRLPEGSFLHWRPRQFVFEGAEVDYDPDEEEDDDDDDCESSSSESDTDGDEISSSDNRESGTDNELVSDSASESTKTACPSTPTSSASSSSERLESAVLGTAANSNWLSNVNSKND